MKVATLGKLDSTVSYYHLLTAWIILQLGDIFTTRYILGKGGEELNPLFGSHPSLAYLVIAKTFVVLSFMFLLNRKRIKTCCILCVVYLFVVTWNLMNIVMFVILR